MIYLHTHGVFQPWLQPLHTLLEQRSQAVRLYQPETRLTADDLLVYIGHLADDEADHLNTVCHATGTRLLLAAPAGELFQAGPLIIYGETPCVACYREQHPAQRDNGYQYHSPSALPDSSRYTPDAVSGLLVYLVDVLVALTAPHSSDALPGGQIYYLHPEDGVAQYRIRAAKAGTCPVCSFWVSHAAENYITLQKGSS